MTFGRVGRSGLIPPKAMTSGSIGRRTKRGLNKAAFARMAVLDRLREEDSEEGGEK